MKGIVLDINGEHAVVLTKSNDYKKINMINGRDYSIGEEIQLPKMNFHLKLPLVNVNKVAFKYVAAMLLILVVSFQLHLVYQYNQVIGYVNIDINPSVQFSYNYKLKVIDVVALNEDAVVLVEKMSIKRMFINEAIKLYIQSARDNGYISDNTDTGIIVSLTRFSKQLEMKTIKQAVSDTTKGINSLQVEYFLCDGETYERAKERNESPGLMLIKRSLEQRRDEDENLELVNKEIDFDEMSTYELIKYFNGLYPIDYQNELDNICIPDSTLDVEANQDIIPENGYINNSETNDAELQMTVPNKNEMQDIERQNIKHDNNEEQNNASAEESPKNKEVQGEDPKGNESQGELPYNNGMQDETPQGNGEESEAPKSNEVQDESHQNNGEQSEDQKNNEMQDESPQNNGGLSEAPKSNEMQDESPQNNGEQSEAPKSNVSQDETPHNSELQDESSPNHEEQGGALQNNIEQDESLQNNEIQSHELENANQQGNRGN